MLEEAWLKKEAEEKALAIKNKVKFVHSRHILVSDEELAQKIYNEIYEEYKDEPTAEIIAKYAEEYSECPSKNKGGKLTAFMKG